MHSWTLALFLAGAGLVVIAWATDAWRARRLRVSSNLLQLPLLGLIAFGLVQLMPLGGATVAGDAGVAPVRSLSLDPYSTRFVMMQLAALLVYFAAALTFIDSPRRLRTVVRTLIIFGFLLAVFGMIQFFVSPDKIYGLRETKQSLAFGPFINRHHFAGAMEMALALPLGLLLSGAIERERYIIYAFAAGLMGIAIILTNSRGGMLSLVLEIMFIVMVSGAVRARSRRRSSREQGQDGGRGEGRRSRLRSIALRAAAGFALVMVLFTGVLFFGGEEALNRLVGSVNSEDPTTGRVHFWRGTIGIIRDNPLTGTGLGSFSVAYSRYDTGGGRLYRLEQAHNDYLQTLSDAGLVGAALGLFFIVMLFRMSFQRMQSDDPFRRGVALGALGGCFAVLVHSFFDFPLHTTSNALLFLVLAALATLNGRVESRANDKRRRRSGGHSSSSGRRRRPAPSMTGETDVNRSLPDGNTEAGI